MLSSEIGSPIRTLSGALPGNPQASLGAASAPSGGIQSGEQAEVRQGPREPSVGVGVGLQSMRKHSTGSSSSAVVFAQEDASVAQKAASASVGPSEASNRQSYASGQAGTQASASSSAVSSSAPRAHG